MLQIDLWKRVLIILTCAAGLWLALPNAFYGPVEQHNDAVKAISVAGATPELEAQKALWGHVENDVRNQRPELNDTEVFDEVIKYVSNPHRFERDDPQTWPVHATGGAVDLTLRSLKNGELLDMGSGFDEICAYTPTAAFELLHSDGKCNSDHPPLRNRRLLYWAMTNSGFANYPQELWHFDRGTQLYVVNSAGADKAAWYGYCDPPGTK